MNLLLVGSALLTGTAGIAMQNEQVAETVTETATQVGEFKQQFVNGKDKINPTSLIDFKSESKTIHPTQKPILLMEYLIRTYTNENETVLDFTMGSGSTMVACKNLNRKGIGIEKEEN